MELTARIATLRLAETFVISRESSDEDDVVQVELRHDGFSGFGEGAPIERYQEALAADKQHEIKAVLFTHNEPRLPRWWQ